MTGRSGLRRILALGALALAAALPALADSEPSPQTAAARETIATLRGELQNALRSALPEGPEAAVGACQEQAPAIAARLQGGGVRVGRTSHRLRNPANAPEAWMLPFLDEFGSGEPQPGAWRSVRLGPRQVGVVEPIYLKPLCATCHGEQVQPALLESIRARYPEDRATGFRVGELRGLFWAVVEAGEAP